MPHASNAELLVLLSLRLKSFAPTTVVAQHAGLPEGEVAALLEQFAAAGWARYREGNVTGWSLLPAGRTRGEALLAAELDRIGARDHVTNVYQRFLALNPELLRICTDWQVRTDIDEQALNDHSDSTYDAQVIARLEALHESVLPLTAELAAELERFAGYGPRFSAALERIKDGDGDWFTRPMIDSYHTVWFELHENLLATLGIERASEQRPERSA